jgi:hypothetical protein
VKENGRCNNTVHFDSQDSKRILMRLKLTLEQAEYSALLKVAGAEMRSPIDQIHFLLRKELQRRGLLKVEAGHEAQRSSKRLVEGSEPLGQSTRRQDRTHH